MDLVLIRHARPVRVDGGPGPADPGLTDVGVRQAEAMADWMAHESFDALYVSPMARARQTSNPLEARLGMEADVVPEVAEFDAGEATYLPMDEAKSDKEVWRRFVAEQQSRDLTQFAKTVNEALEELIGRHRGQRIAVVCHGGVVNVWAAHVLGLSPKMFFEPDYTSIHRFIAASSGERSVASLNEASHLRSLG